MFDNIGKDPDKEAGKRRAASAGLTVFGFIAVIAGSLGVAAYMAVEVVEELLDNSEMVEVLTEMMEEEAPPPPPPPPPAASQPVEEEIDPDEMDEDVEELDKEVEEEIKEDKGVPDAGVEGGVEGGEIGGEIGGVLGGVVGGTGAKVFHHSELEVKKRMMPGYPKQAKELNLGDQRCLAVVHINETGQPTSVEVQDCPKVFHASTIAAIMKWRWYPPKDGKQKVKAQTTIAVKYKLR